MKRRKILNNLVNALTNEYTIQNLKTLDELLKETKLEIFMHKEKLFAPFPKDIIQEILSFAGLSSYSKLLRVSKHWNESLSEKNRYAMMKSLCQLIRNVFRKNTDNFEYNYERFLKLKEAKENKETEKIIDDVREEFVFSESLNSLVDSMIVTKFEEYNFQVFYMANEEIFLTVKGFFLGKKLEEISFHIKSYSDYQDGHRLSGNFVWPKNGKKFFVGKEKEKGIVPFLRVKDKKSGECVVIDYFIGKCIDYLVNGIDIVNTTEFLELLDFIKEKTGITKLKMLDLWRFFFCCCIGKRTKLYYFQDSWKILTTHKHEESILQKDFL